MKNQLGRLLTALALCASLHQAAAQGTAFTYEGQLGNGAGPANGNYDLTFSLYNAATGGAQTGVTQTELSVGVTNGLFAASVDFGAGVFTGAPYWLQIGVRTNGNGAFTALTPRQPLAPTPYAVFAEGANAAGLSGTIPAGDFSGTYDGTLTLNNAGNSFVGNGTGLTNVNAGLLGGLAASNLWQTTGNAGTAPNVNFLGTSDNEPLIFRADNQIGLQLQYASSGGFLSLNDQSGMNLIGGFWGNIISNGVVGGTIAGGGYSYRSGLLHGSSPNMVTQSYGTVGGGAGNSAGNFATVPGGFANIANGGYSFAAGQSAQALHPGAFVWADTQNGYFTSTTNDEFSIRANGGVRIQADTGIHLNAGDRPLVVRDWNPFAATAPSYKAGIGRWGLFMEPHYLTLGIPSDDVSGSYFQFAKYDVNGSPTELAQVDQSGNLSASGGLHVDVAGTHGLNSGTVLSNALTFGTGPGGSGEGMASKRTGSNPYDLEFYTGFVNRMTINSSGDVGIGTDQPTAALDVNGESVVVEAGGAQAYIGAYGENAAVQIGSIKSGVTSVSFFNPTDFAAMNIICSSITILGGADLAEPFSFSQAGQPVSEGEVVVIDENHPGQLKLTDQPYDTRVAGVVSGANGIHPGIQMHQQGLLDGGRNVALTGRVYVQADASNGAIRPGDLLTTSSTQGRAMRVSDHTRAQGAILGKAMTGLSGGNGMVLVLVTLQ